MKLLHLSPLPLSLGVVLLLASCSAQKFLKEDEYLLHKTSLHCDNKELDVSELDGFIKQRPNTKWFSLFKVPLGVYCWSGLDSTKKANKFWRRMGEAPVVYDSTLMERSRSDLEKATRNLGYLRAEVTATAVKGSKDTVDSTASKSLRSYHCDVRYDIHTAKRYSIRNVGTRIDDPALDSIFQSSPLNNDFFSLASTPFDVNVLSKLRSQITSLILNNGYYRFNNNYVQFEADTTVGSHQVDLTLYIPFYQYSADSLSPHHVYHIRDVDVVYQNEGNKLSEKFLSLKSALHPGDIYTEEGVMQTTATLSNLSAVSRASVALKPHATDTLDATISITTNKRHAISAEVEGTNSAGDFGAAISIGYQNRNFFRRSASFGIKVRGAFEAITGLEGYADQNYVEYGTEFNLNFPELLLPVKHSYKRKVKALSTASLMFSSQDRPEFHRKVLTAAWRYKWNVNGMLAHHRVDLIDINYVFLPWISETFRKEYLSDNSSRNAILRYNYEDLFIIKWGYTFQYTNIPANAQNGSYGRNAYSMRFSIETAGNLLYGISNAFGTPYSEEKHAYTLFNIAYAQYAKFDFDFAKSFKVDQRNSFAIHAAFGIAYPYGNSTVLPYEKRYFGGGANSVRGWSVRGLGPGSFSGSDGNVDFIRQTGDLKLDLSIEWRTKLFWKLDAAVFVDGGNIWTLRNYEEQPGGQFKFDSFYKQIAVAYGLGFRLNFGFFLLRLDGGMKAINPAYASGKERYAIIYPNFKRDFQLHFAIGLPF